MTVEKNFFTLYDTWHQSEQGAFALRCGLRLTEKMLTHWPRRGHSILQVYCEHASTLELLWRSGLDVSAVLPSSALLQSVESSVRQRFDIHTLAPAALDNLPWADKSFDYVALMLPPLPDTHAYPPLHALLAEAIRVAAKGVLFQGWNPCSVVGMRHTWRKKTLAPFLQAGLWHSWRDVTQTLLTLSQSPAPTTLTRSLRRLHTRSTLMSAMRHWGKKSFMQKYNDLILPIPMGALMQVRVDLADSIAMTSTPLRFNPLSGATMQPAPVTKRSQNYQTSQKTIQE